jgi:hypothetical protein
MIVEIIKEALEKLDWQFITPSRYDYRARKRITAEQKTWQERTFAYELYHQLRAICDALPKLKKAFVIHAEVRKAYQHIPDFDRMPDFIFHQPRPGQNFAVVEIKLASRSIQQIREDLSKLYDFKNA